MYLQVSYDDREGFDSEDEAEAERREKAAKQELVPAFMESQEGYDDEVERVLGHRYPGTELGMFLQADSCPCRDPTWTRIQQRLRARDVYSTNGFVRGFFLQYALLQCRRAISLVSVELA